MKATTKKTKARGTPRTTAVVVTEHGGLEPDPLTRAMQAIDDQKDLIADLQGLLRTLIHLGTNGDGPDPQALNSTFTTLLAMANGVDHQADEFFRHYELATGAQ